MQEGFGRRETDKQLGVLVAELSKNVITLTGQVSNVITSLDNYPKAKDIIEALALVRELPSRMSELERRQEQEAKCPFSPVKNGGGQAILSDVKAVREEIAKVRTLLYVTIAFLSGLGLLQVGSLIGLVK